MMSKRRFALQAMKDALDHEIPYKKLHESKSLSAENLVPPEVEKKGSKTELYLLWKNIVIVTFSSTLVLTGLFANMSLVTSIVTDSQLVSVFLALMSVVELSCIFTPIFITKLGSRNLLIFSWWLITLFVASMFFPSYWSLIPGAVFLGVGWPLSANAANVYVKDVTVLISKIRDTNMDVLLVRVFGAVGFANQCGIVAGNLAAFFILDSESAHKNGTNSTQTLAICGGNYCNENLEEDAQVKIPEHWRILTLNCILSGCGVAGSLLLLAASKVSSESQLERIKEMEKASKEGFWESWNTAFIPIKHAMALWKNPRQLLLFPYCFYLGLEVPFFLTDFTKAFIACPLGIPYIGIAMAFFGGSNMLFCLIQGNLVHCFGRFSVILFGAAVHIAALITFLSWRLEPEPTYAYFILAAMLGIADATAFTQGFALGGIVYEDNTDLVYSNCIFFNNFASMFAFAFSYFLCINVKVYLIAGFLIFSIICLMFLEHIHKHSKLKSKIVMA